MSDKAIVFALARVEYMPELLEQGVLYVSEAFELAIHLCACGCGQRTVTPTGAGGWILTLDGDAATLEPSIGNQQFPCRSHYWIRNGRVVWA